MIIEELPYTQIGLVLDIVGVILIFRFGLPTPTATADVLNVQFGPKEDDELDQKRRRYDTISKVGLLLIALGFVLQFVGSMIH